MPRLELISSIRSGHLREDRKANSFRFARDTPEIASKASDKDFPILIGVSRNQVTSVWPTAHSSPPAADVAYKIVGIRSSCAAFFLGTPLLVSKCDAAITAGTYARVSAGINRLLLKSAKSLLPEIKTAFCTTISPTLYAARTSDQSSNCACRSRRYRAAARVDFGTSRRSSVSLFIVRPERRAVSGMNCQIPRAPLGERAVGCPPQRGEYSQYDQGFELPTKSKHVQALRYFLALVPSDLAVSVSALPRSSISRLRRPADK